MRREERSSSSTWYIVVPTFPPSARFCHTLRCARKDDEGEGDGGGRVVAGEGEEGLRGGGAPWIVAKVLLTLGVFAFLQEDDSGYL